MTLRDEMERDVLARLAAERARLMAVTAKGYDRAVNTEDRRRAGVRMARSVGAAHMRAAYVGDNLYHQTRIELFRRGALD